MDEHDYVTLDGHTLVTSYGRLGFNGRVENWVWDHQHDLRDLLQAVLCPNQGDVELLTVQVTSSDDGPREGEICADATVGVSEAFSVFDRECVMTEEHQGVLRARIDTETEAATVTCEPCDDE